MANTDKSPEQYYNKIPELKSSNLYIRDKMDSTCSYSDDRCGKYKNVFADKQQFQHERHVRRV
jgi:hypothetical protein